MSDPEKMSDAPSPEPAGQRRWRFWDRQWLAMLGALVVGVAGGALARSVHMPLPWMLGSLFATAALSLAGLPLRTTRFGRAGGQVIVGASTGLLFTKAVVLKLIALLPLMIGGTLFAMIIGCGTALLLARLTGLDKTTAFFCTIPGGVVEMANIAPRYGATPEPITVAQIMRVFLIVSIAPFLVIHFSPPGGGIGITQVAEMAWPMTVLLLIAATAGGAVLAWFNTPNRWLLGPLAVAAIASASGLVAGRVPGIVIIIAQVAIGISLGTQFRREFLTRLGRFMLAAGLAVLITIAAMAGFAFVVATAMGLPLPTMVLAYAPAGMAEMVLTAKVLGLDAPLITGFQLVRIVLIAVFCRLAYRVFDRLTARFH